MVNRKRQRFSRWVYPAGVAIGAGLFTAVLLAAIYLRPAPASGQNATALLTVISAPTSTPQPVATLIQTPTPTPGGPETMIGGAGVGTYVQISGTGGDGLRLRQEPGIEADILFMGYEAEVFKVTDGPKNQDGYVWWYLTAPYDTNRSGWAAANYLTVINLTP
jgi:hypothetical protein